MHVEFLTKFAESFLRPVQLSLIGANRKSAAVQKDNHSQFLKLFLHNYPETREVGRERFEELSVMDVDQCKRAQVP
jgi:hypothetical protein